MREKIQKVLANAGLGSRRQIEDWIRAGRITINGKPASIGDRITTEAAVCIDARPIKLIKSAAKKTRMLIYNKPEGEICTRSDPEKRPTVFGHLPLLRNSRWIAVGRLDINTQGLMLFTNNGELANRLMHPRAELEREYAVRVHGVLTPLMIKQLQTGVELEDGMAHFEKITEVGGEASNRWFHVIVKEGRNRLVRRLWESQNVQISRLMRVRFGSLELPRSLHRGQWQEMEPAEIDLLVRSLNLNDVKLNAKALASEEVDATATVVSDAEPTRPSRSKRPALSKPRDSRKRSDGSNWGDSKKRGTTKRSDETSWGDSPKRSSAKRSDSTSSRTSWRDSDKPSRTTRSDNTSWNDSNKRSSAKRSDSATSWRDSDRPSRTTRSDSTNRNDSNIRSSAKRSDSATSWRDSDRPSRAKRSDNTSWSDSNKRSSAKRSDSSSRGESSNRSSTKRGDGTSWNDNIKRSSAKRNNSKAKPARSR